MNSGMIWSTRHFAGKPHHVTRNRINSPTSTGLHKCSHAVILHESYLISILWLLLALRGAYRVFADFFGPFNCLTVRQYLALFANFGRLYLLVHSCHVQTDNRDRLSIKNCPTERIVRLFARLWKRWMCFGQKAYLICLWLQAIVRKSLTKNSFRHKWLSHAAVTT